MTRNGRGPKPNLPRQRAIIRALRKHRNICTVARLFRVSRQRIHQIARIQKFPSSTLCGQRQAFVRTRHRTDQRYAKVVARLRRDRNFTVKAAANELGVTRESVYIYLQSRGIRFAKGTCFLCRKTFSIKNRSLAFHICGHCMKSILGILAVNFRFLHQKFPRFFDRLLKAVR